MPRKNLSFKKKIEILDEIKAQEVFGLLNGSFKNDLAKKYGTSVQTIYRIKKKESTLRDITDFVNRDLTR